MKQSINTLNNTDSANSLDVVLKWLDEILNSENLPEEHRIKLSCAIDIIKTFNLGLTPVTRIWNDPLSSIQLDCNRTGITERTKE